MTKSRDQSRVFPHREAGDRDAGEACTKEGGGGGGGEREREREGGLNPVPEYETHRF